MSLYRKAKDWIHYVRRGHPTCKEIREFMKIDTTRLTDNEIMVCNSYIENGSIDIVAIKLDDNREHIRKVLCKVGRKYR